MKMYGKVRVDKRRYDGLDNADTADLLAFRDLFKDAGVACSEISKVNSFRNTTG